MRRRFRNDRDHPVHFPDQHVTIHPGHEGEVEMPEEQPTPDGLTETTGGGRRERRPKAEAPASRRGARRRRETVTEPKPAPRHAVTEPTTTATVEE